MVKTPTDRLFSKEHEWIKIEGNDALMGISDHAQSSLGDVVYLELPEVGASVVQGKAIGVVESVKAVSDIYAPVSGTVKAVNQKAVEHPENINRDPYGEGWLIVIEINADDDKKNLLSATDYDELLAQEQKC